MNRLALFILLLFPLSAAEYPPFSEGEDPTSCERICERWPHCPQDNALSLNEALGKTLQCRWSVQISKLDIPRAAGLYQESRGPFDPLVNIRGDQAWRDNAQEDGIRTGEKGQVTFGQVAVSKKLRAGTVLSTDFNIERENDPVNPGPFQFLNTARLRFLLDQPLLRDFIYGRDRSIEEANCFNLEATKWETLFSISEDLLATINAYWDASAARMVMEAQESLEKRLEQIVAFTERMVQEDLMAPNDLEQPLAELERARSNRIEAQQNYYASIHALWLAMGSIDVDWSPEMLDLNLDPLPDGDLRAASEDFFAMAPTLCCNRGDIQGSSLRIKASQALVQGAKNDTLPELNLNVGFELKKSLNGRPARPFFESVNFSDAEKDYLFGVRFSYPLCNNAAQGRLKTLRAELGQNCYRKQDLLATALNDFMVTLKDYNSLIDQHMAAASAVEHFTTLTTNEVKKLEVGQSTLFVVLDFERELNTAMIENIRVTNNYVKQLANLHFSIGILVTCDPCSSGYQVKSFAELSRLPEPRDIPRCSHGR